MKKKTDGKNGTTANGARYDWCPVMKSAGSCALAALGSCPAADLWMLAHKAPSVAGWSRELWGQQPVAYAGI